MICMSTANRLINNAVYKVHFLEILRRHLHGLGRQYSRVATAEADAERVSLVFSGPKPLMRSVQVRVTATEPGVKVSRSGGSHSNENPSIDPRHTL